MPGPQVIGRMHGGTQVPPPEQMPLMHMPGGGQAMPHMPQLAGSVWVLVQIPPQRVFGGVQVVPQIPPEQVWPPEQMKPHEPQLLGSLLVFTQSPPQSMLGGVHVVPPQLPTVQV